MSSYSIEDRSESSSNESRILDFLKSNPYDFELVCETQMFSSEWELKSETEEQRRTGNTVWWQYSEWKLLANYTDSLCFQDTDEVPEELFEGQNWITE